MHANFFTPEPVAGARARPQLRVATLRLRGHRTRPARLGSRAAAGRSCIAVGDDHDVRAAARHELYPLRLHARLLGAGRRVELVVYAHSLDFGKKAYGNLVELARLQQLVAGELGLPVGRLTVLCKSAHLYEPEWALMAGLVAQGAWLQPGAGTA